MARRTARLEFRARAHGNDRPRHDPNARRLAGGQEQMSSITGTSAIKQLLPARALEITKAAEGSERAHIERMAHLLSAGRA